MPDVKKQPSQKKQESGGESILEKIDSLPGLSVFKIAWKELMLIKSQKAGLITAFTLAIVVMGTLALAFGGSGSMKKVDVAVFAPDNIKDFDSNEFLNTLEKNESVKIHKLGSAEQVKDSLKKRQSKVGVVLNNPEESTGRFVIDLYYDNSSIAASSLFFDIAKSQVQNIGFSMSQKLLKQIWGKLGEINSNLGSEVSRIDGFLQRLDESEQKLNKLESDLNKLNAKEAKDALERQSTKILEFNVKLDETGREIDSFISTVSDISTKLSSTKAKISGYRSEISATKSELQGYRDQLESIQAELQPAATVPQVGIAIGKIGEAKARISLAISRLESAERELASAEREIDDLQSKINDSENGVLAKLQKNKADIELMKTEVSQTKQDLNKMQAFVNNLDSTVKEVQELIVNSKAQKTEVGQKLQESKKMINSFIGSLGDLAKINPDFLADPLILNKIQVFNIERLGVVAPMALVLLLMLTTVLLTGVSFVDERNQGAYSRMLLSTTPKFLVFAGKIIGQLIFALAQAAIIIALLLLLNEFSSIKITINASLPLVFAGIVIVCFAFINWGLLISNFTKNQGTTILMSLLFIIPMLFLSGVIIPLELINPALQGIAQVLPLSLGILVLSEIMVKGTLLQQLAWEIAMLIIPAIAILAFTVWNKKLK